MEEAKVASFDDYSREGDQRESDVRVFRLELYLGNTEECARNVWHFSSSFRTFKRMCKRSYVLLWEKSLTV